MRRLQGGTLLVDTSFLGDVLCAEPLVRAAAAKFGAPVDFLAAPGGAQVLDGHPNLRQVLVFDKRGADRGGRGLWRAARRLRRRGYQRAICSHRSWRTALLLRLAGVPERIGFDNAAGAWLYTRRIAYPRGRHEIERNLELIGGGNWERPRLFPSEQERTRARSLLPPRPFVALAPGSLWATKRWPAERFAAAAAGLAASGFVVVLIGGKEDRELAELVIREAKAGQDKLINLCGATSLRESYAVLEQAHALLTNDSAPMHLGVAAGIPVLAVYCSTLPEFGFAPRGPRDRVFEVHGLECRPCGIHGRRRCPMGHFRCGWEVEIAGVVAGIEAAIQGRDHV